MTAATDAAARPPRLPALTLAAAAPPPRDARWWVGITWLVLSAMLLGFLLHVAVFSQLQFARDQQIAYGELRTALAKAEVPTGSLDLERRPVAPGTSIAILDIPAAGIEGMVVGEGTTSHVMRSGPGHRRDTVFPGQAGTSVVMGRQAAYGGPFGRLHELSPGDQITVTTGQGESVFEVFSIRRAGDPLPDPLASGRGRLELVTADGPALMTAGALHVDAQLVGTPKETPARAFVPEMLPASEREMAGDPGAWGPALVAAQVLLLAGVALVWLRRKWGGWQTYLVGLPVVLVLAVTTADLVMDLLPNLI